MNKIFGSTLLVLTGVAALLLAETPTGSWVADNGDRVSITTTNDITYTVTITYADGTTMSGSSDSAEQAQGIYDSTVGRNNGEGWSEET